MQVGERYTLAWKYPHRIEATIVALEPNGVVVETEHRCPITCYLQQMRGTLPLHGETRYAYADFGRLFVQMNPDAIALPA